MTARQADSTIRISLYILVCCRHIPIVTSARRLRNKDLDDISFNFYGLCSATFVPVLYNKRDFHLSAAWRGFTSLPIKITQIRYFPGLIEPRGLCACSQRILFESWELMAKADFAAVRNWYPALFTGNQTRRIQVGRDDFKNLCIMHYSHYIRLWNL